MDLEVLGLRQRVLKTPPRVKRRDTKVTPPRIFRPIVRSRSWSTPLRAKARKIPKRTVVRVDKRGRIAAIVTPTGKKRRVDWGPYLDPDWNDL